MRILPTIIFLSFTLISFGQNQLSMKDQTYLSKEIQSYVNNLRDSLGVDDLELSDTLGWAALIQANYQAKIDKVTHAHKKSKLATPGKRVKSVKGKQFVFVGENCLGLPVDDFSFSRKELKKMAYDMFVLWRNSPGHYKNMINPKYTLGDFGFSYNPKSKMVYATQVFASRGVLIDGQLSEDGFGIYPADEDCKMKYGSFNNIVANMGNSIKLKGNDIYLHYHNKAYFDKMFPNRDDGLAIDIVTRNQFECKGSSRLDLSPVYDGVLLEPVYKNELWENNEANSDYRLITKIGELPDGFNKEQDFQFSLIIIDQGQSCMYVVPAEVPSRKYALRSIEPFMNDPAISFLSTGIVFSQEIKFEFERNRTQAVENPKIYKSDLAVSNVEIFSFTSVEGDTIINYRLHNSRAKTIKRYLKKNISFHDSVVTIVAKENWEKMYFQIHYFGLDSLISWEKDSIRKLVRSNDSTLNWDELLFEQRRSTALIHYLGELTDSSTIGDTLSMNLKTAIASRNWRLANKSLYEIFYNEFEGKDSLMFDTYVFEACLIVQPILKNALAVYSQVYYSNVHQTTVLLHTWLSKSGGLDVEEKSNLMHLYTLLSSKLINKWDLPSTRLARVIHPDKVKSLISEDFREELLLNIHLSFIQYYGQTNNKDGISRSFGFISNYFREHSLRVEDDVDLCLFFNSWSRYDLTNSYLSEKFEEGEINEDGVFLLLQTSWFYGKNIDQNLEGVGLHEKAVELNKKRYCRYIYKNFQNMRNEDVKALYCEECL